MPTPTVASYGSVTFLEPQHPRPSSTIGSPFWSSGSGPRYRLREGDTVTHHLPSLKPPMPLHVLNKTVRCSADKSKG